MITRTSRRAHLLSALAVAAVVACSPPDLGPELERASPSGLEPGDDERTEARLLMEDLAYEPQHLTVPVGTLIILENRDDTPHTVTHGENGQRAEDAAFDIELAPGDRDELIVSQPGEYTVTCRLHPEMEMTLTVVD